MPRVCKPRWQSPRGTDVADVAKTCRGCANHAGNQDPGLCHVCCNARGICKASTTWRRHALRITPCRGWQHAGNYHRTDVVATCRGWRMRAADGNPRWQSGADVVAKVPPPSDISVGGAGATAGEPWAFYLPRPAHKLSRETFQPLCPPSGSQGVLLRNHLRVHKEKSTVNSPQLL